jgi:hypothetical protein
MIIDKQRAEEIKMELIDQIENGTIISNESAQDLLDLLEEKFSIADPSSDSSPMIGGNPFKRGEEQKTIATKDFNTSLNYHVSRFNDFDGEDTGEVN